MLVPGVRILMLTVAENEDSLLAALKAGAHGYVLKGVAAGELVVTEGQLKLRPDAPVEVLQEKGPEKAPAR